MTRTTITIPNTRGPLVRVSRLVGQNGLYGGEERPELWSELVFANVGAMFGFVRYVKEIYSTMDDEDETLFSPVVVVRRRGAAPDKQPAGHNETYVDPTVGREDNWVTYDKDPRIELVDGEPFGAVDLVTFLTQLDKEPVENTTVHDVLIVAQWESGRFCMGIEDSYLASSFKKHLGKLLMRYMLRLDENYKPARQATETDMTVYYQMPLAQRRALERRYPTEPATVRDIVTSIRILAGVKWQQDMDGLTDMQRRWLVNTIKRFCHRHHSHFDVDTVRELLVDGLENGPIVAPAVPFVATPGPVVGLRVWCKHNRLLSQYEVVNLQRSNTQVVVHVSHLITGDVLKFPVNRLLKEDGNKLFPDDMNDINTGSQGASAAAGSIAGAGSIADPASAAVVDGDVTMHVDVSESRPPVLRSQTTTQTQQTQSETQSQSHTQLSNTPCATWRNNQERPTNTDSIETGANSNVANNNTDTKMVGLLRSAWPDYIMRCRAKKEDVVWLNAPIGETASPAGGNASMFLSDSENDSSTSDSGSGSENEQEEENEDGSTSLIGDDGFNANKRKRKSKTAVLRAPQHWYAADIGVDGSDGDKEDGNSDIDKENADDPDDFESETYNNNAKSSKKKPATSKCKQTVKSKPKAKTAKKETKKRVAARTKSSRRNTIKGSGKTKSASKNQKQIKPLKRRQPSSSASSSASGTKTKRVKLEQSDDVDEEEEKEKDWDYGLDTASSASERESGLSSSEEEELQQEKEGGGGEDTASSSLTPGGMRVVKNEFGSPASRMLSPRRNSPSASASITSLHSPSASTTRFSRRESKRHSPDELEPLNPDEHICDAPQPRIDMPIFAFARNFLREKCVSKLQATQDWRHWGNEVARASVERKENEGVGWPASRAQSCLWELLNKWSTLTPRPRSIRVAAAPLQFRVVESGSKTTNPKTPANKKNNKLEDVQPPSSIRAHDAGTYAAAAVARGGMGLPKKFGIRKYDVMYRVKLETFLCYRMTMAGYQSKAHITQSLDRLSAITFAHADAFHEHVVGEMSALGIKKRRRRGQPTTKYTRNEVKDMVMSLDKGRTKKNKKNFLNLRKMKHPRLCRSAMRVLLAFYAKERKKRTIPDPKVPKA